MKKVIALPILLASYSAIANTTQQSQIFNPWDYNQYLTAVRTATDVGGNTWKVELDDDKFEFAQFNREQTKCDSNVSDTMLQWSVLDKNINVTKSCRLVERFGKAARTIYIINDKENYNYLIDAFSQAESTVAIKKEDGSEVHYTKKDFKKYYNKYKNREVITYEAWSTSEQGSFITSKTSIKKANELITYNISFDKQKFSIVKSQFLDDVAVPACNEHEEMKENIRFRSGDFIELKTTCSMNSGVLKSTTIIDDPSAISVLVAQLNTKKGFILKIKKLDMTITAKDFIGAHEKL